MPKAKQHDPDPVLVELPVACPNCGAERTIKVTEAEAIVIRGARLAGPYSLACTIHTE